jgi:hypothetical protein
LFPLLIFVYVHFFVLPVFQFFLYFYINVCESDRFSLPCINMVSVRKYFLFAIWTKLVQ